jgi:organic radical activating enzyme
MNKKFYCNLKWDMAGINLSDQSIAQCCRTDWLAYDLNASKENVINIFNADHLIKDRQDILNGIVPVSCKNCVDYETQGIQIQNYLLDSRESNVYTSTIKSKLPPRIDFVLHNFCNLTCVYCGPIFSSSWTKDIKEHGDYQTKTISIKDIVKNKITLSEYEHSDSFNVLRNIVRHPDFNTVKKITLLGGEPLINPYLLDVVKEILDHNSTVKVWITTGLGVPDKTFISVIAKLKNLDKNNQLGINVSAEATGSKFEFIRHGITWHDFQSRFKHLIDNFTIDRISIMTVLFILGIFDYKNFLLYIRDLGFDTKKIQFGFLEDPQYLSLLTFDPDITDPYIQDLLDSDLISDDLRNTLLSTIGVQSPDRNLNTQFSNYIQEFAKRRNLDIDIFPQSLRNLYG